MFFNIVSAACTDAWRLIPQERRCLVLISSRHGYNALSSCHDMHTFTIQEINKTQNGLRASS